MIDGTMVPIRADLLFSILGQLSLVQQEIMKAELKDDLQPISSSYETLQNIVSFLTEAMTDAYWIDDPEYSTFIKTEKE
jgi:hypothetical protein